MTRGRKKDLTIPPSRALVQQRDYRARKAQYVSELEDRCRRAEDENERLRRDLAEARAGLAVPAAAFDPQTAQASSELMHNLSIASDSLARFQHLAFSVSSPSKPGESSLSIAQQALSHTFRPAAGFLSPAPSPPSPPYSDPMAGSARDHRFSNPKRPRVEEPTRSTDSTRLPSFSSSTPSPSFSSVPISESNTDDRYAAQKRLRRDESPHDADFSQSSGSQRNGSPRTQRSRSQSAASECCGGIMDCRELIERVEEQNRDTSTIPRMSILRLTTDLGQPPPAPFRHDARYP